MDEQNKYQETVTQTTYTDRAKGIWRDFGPLLVGLLVLLVVIAGGWYLWRNRIQPASNEVVLDEQTQNGNTSLSNSPEAQLSFGNPTPTPSAYASPAPSPTPTPKAVAIGTTKGGQAVKTTKGGEKLPQTGIPLVIPALFSLTTLAGVSLRHFLK